MISSQQFHWTQGRIYTVLAVALLCGWALCVIHTTEAYTPHLRFDAEEAATRQRARHLLAVPDRSVLLQLYRNLSLRVGMIDPRGGELLDPRSVVMILQPQSEAPDALADEIERYVKAGGRLVVITSTPFEMLRRFGVRLVHRPDASGGLVTSTGAVFEGDHAKTLEFGTELEVRTDDRSMLPLLVRRDGICTGALVQHGKGSVIVVGGDPDRFGNIAREDNVIFLTNLVMGRTPAETMEEPARLALPDIKVLDLDPEILRQMYDLVRMQREREQEQRDRWNYDSLWSLIQANPVCAALIQLLIGFLVFLGARAHRLGDPLPESATLLAPLPALAPGWGAFLEKSNGFVLAADSAFEWHRRRLVKRLGLGAEADPKQIVQSLAALSSTYDETFKRIASLVTQIRRLPRRQSAADKGGEMLLEIWHGIDFLEKELGLRD